MNWLIKRNIMKSYKIGFVLDDGLDKPDGVQQYILTLGEWLSNKGHQVRYLVGESNRPDIKNAIVLSKNIHVRFNGNKLTIPLYPRLKKIKETLNKENFDIIHIQTPYSPFMGAQVVRLSSKKSAIIGTFHILPLSKIHSLGNKLLAILLSSNLKKVNKFLSVSRPAREFAKKIYGIESTVLGNPVKIPKDIPYQKSSNANFKIVFLGRLVSRKNCLTLLKAVKQLEDKHNLDVEIAGTGKQEPMLKKFVENNYLKDIVKFVGFIQESEKYKFLSSADLAVFPSIGGESFGIVIVEAVASGGPVVLAGNNSGYASVMQDSPEDLFNPKDFNELSKKIAQYKKSEKLLIAAKNKQKVIKDKYAVDSIGSKLLNEYEKLI